MKFTSKRIDYIDIAKGIGIILVIAGHCIPMKTIPSRIIYTFHMPLFFFLAGLCFNEVKYISFLSFIKKRIRQLLLPCIIFSLLMTLGGQYCLNGKAFESLSEGLPWALWFIPILFLSEVIFFFISKVTIGKYTDAFRFTLIILFAYIGFMFQVWHIKIPYSITTLPSAIAFYISANLYKRNIGLVSNNTNVKNIFIVILSFVAIGVSVCNSRIFTDMHYNIMTPLLLNYLCAFIGIHGIIALSRMIDRINKDEFIRRAFLFCGKNTLIIMAIHSFYLNLSRHFIKPILVESDIFNIDFIFALVDQIVLWPLLLLSIFFINKKIPVIIGK